MKKSWGLFDRWPITVIALVLVACGGWSAETLGSVQVAPAYFDSSVLPASTRTPTNGLTGLPATGTPTWLTGGISVDWLITDNGNSTWTYQYTITVTEKSISHWILELSQVDFVDWNNVFNSGSLVDTAFLVGTWDLSANGNGGVTGTIYGVKFTPADSTAAKNLDVVSFTTTQEPIWGDFYARDGNQPMGGPVIAAYNTGLGTDPTGTNFTNWIPRPDGNLPPVTGSSPAPEPISVIVWSVMLCCGSLVTARDRSRTSA